MSVLRFTTSPGPLVTHMTLHDVILNMTSSTRPQYDDNNNNNNVTDMVMIVAAAPDGCVVFPFSQHTPWDNPEDLVSHEEAASFGNIVDVYFLTLFFLLSGPLNVVNMVVFWRHGIKERINLCLFFLALADFVVVTGHFEWQLDNLYSEVTGKANLNNMVHSLAGFIYISGFMTTLIAFERCLCVVSPLKAQAIVRLKTTACVITVGHVVIFGGHFVIATRYRVVCMFDPITGGSVDTFYPGQFYFDHKELVDVLDGILFGILLPGFYITGISTSTVVTVTKLRQMKEWRERSTSAEVSSGAASKDITLTRMLIATNVLFVACTTPALVFHALIPFYPELSYSGKYYNTYYVLLSVQQLLVYINSSVNFFFYYFFGTKFRRTVQHMFWNRCRRNTDSKRLDGNRRTILTADEIQK